jgi:TolA-binding protein
MHRIRRHLLAAVLAALSASAAGAQASQAAPLGPKAALERGVELFGQERYRDAIDAFGKILADPKASAERPDAAYWSALAWLAAGDQSNAAKSIDAFLAAYPGSPRVPDLLYQKGRIHYSRGDYEGSLRVFAAFASAAPASDLMPSSLYWSGECLYALGRLEEAERAFAAVVDKYPTSVKVEASSYRRALIGLEYRERELLRLLTWSHEESLRAVEDFRRRERAYDQSLAIYQKQISDTKRGAATDQDKVLVDLRAQVADLGSRLASSEARLATALADADALRAALAKAGAAPPPAAAVPAARAPALEPDDRSAALAAKARALDLLAFYLERLAKEGSK